MTEEQTEQIAGAGSNAEGSANVNPGNITQSTNLGNASFASAEFEGMDDNFAQVLRGLAENAEALKVKIEIKLKIIITLQKLYILKKKILYIII